MTDKNEVKKEITKEGVKLSHPSGVIQILTPKRLNDIIGQFEKAKADAEKNIADIKKDLAAVSQSP